MKTSHSTLNPGPLLWLCIALCLMLWCLPALAQTPAADWQQHLPGGGVLDNLIPIVAILMVFGPPPVALVLVALFTYRYMEKRQRMRNERIEKLLNAGHPVPDNLLLDGVAAQVSTPEQHLSRGLTLLAFGAGLIIFLWLVASMEVASLGLIFVLLGLARLISWKMASRQTD